MNRLSVIPGLSKMRAAGLVLLCLTLTGCGSLYSYRSGGDAAAQAASASSPSEATTSVRGLSQAITGLL